MDNPRDLAGVIGKARLAELRAIVDPEGRKGNWLRLLTDRQLAEVFFRLRQGAAPYAVTRYAQKEWNIQPHSSSKSLARAMAQFRDSAVGDIRKEVFSKKGTEKEAKKVEKVAGDLVRKIQPLEEYQWMIQEQKKRIQAILTEERKENIQLNATDKMMEHFKRMLEGLVEVAVRLGLVDAQPSEFNVNIKTQFDKLLNLPDVRNQSGKMVDACSKFVSMLEESSVIFEQDSDGVYQPVEEKCKR